MKPDRNPFRDYSAESALFIRRALVAFAGVLLLTGVLIANLYHLQILRFEDYKTRSNENRIAGAHRAQPRHDLRSQRDPAGL